MSLGLRICVGIIFAILLFGGAFLIALSQWEVMSNHGIPWGEIVLAVGAAMMASSVGIFTAHLDPEAKKPVLWLLAALAVIAIIFWLFLGWTDDWKPGLMAFVGVAVGVIVTEGLVCLLKRFSHKEPQKTSAASGSTIV